MKATARISIDVVMMTKEEMQKIHEKDPSAPRFVYVGPGTADGKPCSVFHRKGDDSFVAVPEI